MLNTPVLIIGAGPVGLFAGYLLSKYGVKSIILEKNSFLNDHPKSRNMNARTMEILRTLKNYPELKSFALPKNSRRFAWKYSLSGDDFYSISVKESDARDSGPEHSTFLAQSYIEQHIYELIKDSHLCTILFNHQLQTCSNLKNPITGIIFNNKTETSIPFTTDFLLGCDGTHSMAAQLAVFSYEHFDVPQSQCCNIYANVDLLPIIKKDLSAGYFFTNPKIMGRSILAVNGKDKWLFGIHYSDKRSKSDFTDEHCVKEIQLMIGNANIPIKIINKNFWSSRASIASQFNRNNIFLVGDSAHSMPPTGGLGLNTGFQDAHNLVWKIAFVINHGASSTILNSYHDERYPVGKANIEFSIKNAKRLSIINKHIFQGDLELAKLLLNEHHQHLNHLGLDLGMCYQSELTLDAQSVKPPLSTISQYYPSIYPGCRAPHIDIFINNEICSILDLFENKFTLIKNSQCLELDDILTTSSMEKILKIYQINANIICDIEQWNTLYNMSLNGFVLIRPDGHIAIHQASSDKQSRTLLIKYLNKFKKPYE